MRVTSIRLYPVKGMRGFDVGQAIVEPWGLAGDRRWMLIDPRGRFLTQREIPAMATLSASFLAEGLLLSAAGRPDFHVRVPDGSEQVDVVIWKDRVQASQVEAADTWLEATLGAPARLVYMADPASARPVDASYAQTGDRVSFADGFPLLLTTEASLEDLNRRLDTPLPMDRFRTNIAVEGAVAWAEDGWHSLRIGAATFAVVKPCDRCIVTTTDQHTGLRSEEREPLRTLQTFRRNAKGQVLFGQNLIPIDCQPVHVGDSVEVLG